MSKEWARDAVESDEQVCARELADQANYSVAQYYRRFRKEVGETPIDLRRRLKLERAAYELTRTEMEIATIAFRAGFVAIEAFTRAFRRAFRISPGRLSAPWPNRVPVGRSIFDPLCACPLLGRFSTRRTLNECPRPHDWRPLRRDETDPRPV
ncbi:helix-turn-helix transcriptional regulator [Fimbriimonas ginsengisoli]|uniref:helix-turn-helix transcriptional regulator n=1 Tax=Fimbriimonas ginsengisoli TaxID=1005039 RepID=UPI000A05CA3E